LILSGRNDFSELIDLPDSSFEFEYMGLLFNFCLS